MNGSVDAYFVNFLFNIGESDVLKGLTIYQNGFSKSGQAKNQVCVSSNICFEEATGQYKEIFISLIQLSPWLSQIMRICKEVIQWMINSWFTADA
ncbi:hypothetical protein EGR_01249 [Echinococcus granulosus]|uniref:Uncharacterized protein n=1 Tax=Echinococcus granulosus TaxID=6210 RepID=W6UTY9_ECHGR|nr:hypothetical protein EGR_01249 [Echinococcus granulosus]EUB64121.1 hypothetical protein EGR_01249 [Echinococcus granulosus]